jgi:hypothetical protein
MPPVSSTGVHRVSPQLYRWHWRARLPERRGQLLRVLVRGTLNSCLVEFVEDGARYVTSRNALRRVRELERNTDPREGMLYERSGRTAPPFKPRTPDSSD